MCRGVAPVLGIQHVWQMKKAQNQDGQQTNDAQYSVLALLSHIQETETHH